MILISIGYKYNERCCLLFAFKTWNVVVLRTHLSRTLGMFTHAQDHKFSAILGSDLRKHFVVASSSECELQ